jgi:thymidylate synthase (FAD)
MERATVSWDMGVDFVSAPDADADLTVVNAARVSFNKRSTKLTENDEKLIKYLADHNHWTPFSHVHVTLLLDVPIFVARQIMKHQVGFSVNEQSRRYIDNPPKFYVPKTWRQRAKNIKQGSLGLEIDYPHYSQRWYYQSIDIANDTYQKLLGEGVAPEQARMVLPLSTYTEFWMTGSLAAWARLYKLRVDKHTQAETREVAHKIGKCVENVAPVSWRCLDEVSIQTKIHNAVKTDVTLEPRYDDYMDMINTLRRWHGSGKEPLPADMAAVWDKNTDKLYEE